MKQDSMFVFNVVMAGIILFFCIYPELIPVVINRINEIEQTNRNN